MLFVSSRDIFSEHEKKVVVPPNNSESRMVRDFRNRSVVKCPLFPTEQFQKSRMVQNFLNGSGQKNQTFPRLPAYTDSGSFLPDQRGAHSRSLFYASAEINNKLIIKSLKSQIDSFRRKNFKSRTIRKFLNHSENFEPFRNAPNHSGFPEPFGMYRTIQKVLNHSGFPNYSVVLPFFPFAFAFCRFAFSYFCLLPYQLKNIKNQKKR